MKRLRIFLVLVSIMSIVSVIASCVSEKTATTASTPAINAAEIIAQSTDKLESITSFSFELTHEGGGTPIAMGLVLQEAVGTMVKPDTLTTHITATMGGLSAQVNVITIGSTTYMTNPLTMQWEVLGESFSAVAIFNPNTGIMAILSDIIEPAIVEDNVTDQTEYHIKGKIPVESLRPITMSSVGGTQIDADLWINRDDYSINRIRIVGKITDSEIPGIIRTLKLYDYDVPVEIKAPM